MGSGRKKLPAEILPRLDLVPPFLAWALARVGQGSGKKLRRPSPEEAAATAKMSLRTFNRIGSKLTWAEVKVGQVDGFLAGCNVRLNGLGEVHKFIAQMVKHGTFTLLSPSQKKWFERRYKAWKAAKARVSAFQEDRNQVSENRYRHQLLAIRQDFQS